MSKWIVHGRIPVSRLCIYIVVQVYCSREIGIGSSQSAVHNHSQSHDSVSRFHAALGILFLQKKITLLSKHYLSLYCRHYSKSLTCRQSKDLIGCATFAPAVTMSTQYGRRCHFYSPFIFSFFYMLLFLRNVWHHQRKRWSQQRFNSDQGL